MYALSADGASQMEAYKHLTTNLGFGTTQSISENMLLPKNFGQIISEKNNYLVSNNINQAQVSGLDPYSSQFNPAYPIGIQPSKILFRQIPAVNELQMQSPADYASLNMNLNHPVNMYSQHAQMIPHIHYQPQQTSSSQMVMANPLSMCPPTNYMGLQTRPQQYMFQPHQFDAGNYGMNLQSLANTIQTQSIPSPQIGPLIATAGSELQTAQLESGSFSKIPQKMDAQFQDYQTQNDSKRNTFQLVRPIHTELMNSSFEMQQGILEQPVSFDISSLSNAILRESNNQEKRQLSENSNIQYIQHSNLNKSNIRNSEETLVNQLRQISDKDSQLNGSKFDLRKKSQTEQIGINNNLNKLKGIDHVITQRQENDKLDVLLRHRTSSEVSKAWREDQKLKFSSENSVHSTSQRSSNRKCCALRQIKSGDSSIKIVCSITSVSISKMQESESINQQQAKFPNPNKTAQFEGDTSLIPLNQLVDNSSQNNALSNASGLKINNKDKCCLHLQNKLQRDSSATSPDGPSSLINAKFNFEINDTQIINQSNGINAQLQNCLHNEEQRKILNFNYSNVNQKTQKISKNFKISDQQVTGEDYSCNYEFGKRKQAKLDRSPFMQATLNDGKEDSAGNLKKSTEVFSKAEKNLNKSSQKYFEKLEEKTLKNKASLGNFFDQFDEEEEWEDSFFSHTKTNSKSGGKSFFLVSNYKKKILQSLEPEDQAVLVAMKKSKKFNFSKNVIKQFLKVINAEINYVYYCEDAEESSNNNSNSLERCQIVDYQENNSQIEKEKNRCQNNTEKSIISVQNQPELKDEKMQAKQIDQLNLPLCQTLNEGNSNSIRFSNQKSNRKYFKVTNPTTSMLNDLRSKIKQFLTHNPYTHSSIKKIIVHSYYSLYFNDFLNNFCEGWIQSGKTKYKNEQITMIQFLKLCLRNHKLLIFLSQHDPLKAERVDGSSQEAKE